MTIATITPEQRLTVVKHLAAGKGLDVVATITHLDRAAVLDIGSHHGYPDTGKLSWAVDVLTKKLDEADALPERAERPVPVRPAATASTPAAAGTPVTRPDEIRILLNTAKAHPSKKIQAAADRVFDGLDRLKALIAEDQEKHAEKRRLAAQKAEARAEVDRLKEQLRAAQERLHGPKREKSATATASDGPTAAQIRAWAAEHDVAVPSVGRIPGAVREAYDEAHKDDAA